VSGNEEVDDTVSSSDAWARRRDSSATSGAVPGAAAWAAAMSWRARAKRPRG
jgi:hypothetical protein